jgi:hypothetical protein
MGGCSLGAAVGAAFAASATDAAGWPCVPKSLTATTPINAIAPMPIETMRIGLIFPFVSKDGSSILAYARIRLTKC